MNKLIIISIMPVTLVLSSITFAQTTDSIQFNSFESYDSDLPPLEYNLDKLPQPTIFVLDNKRISGAKYSEPKIDQADIESTIIQGRKELEELGYSGYNSAVILKSKDQ